jgi:hypothetical protein
MSDRPLPVIKVVGVSAAGKSTLVARLRAEGYDARPVSQEHSGVSDLRQQFELAHALIYLDVSLEAQQTRRPDVTWDAAARAEELRRLANAREHADLVLDTTAIPTDTVAALTLAWLRRRRLRRSEDPLPPLPATGAPR